MRTFLILLLLSTGWGTALAQPSPVPPDRLDAFWGEAERTIREGDVEAYAALYHPDAVIEQSVMARPLSRRIPDRAAVERRTTAWQESRNAAEATVDWQFTTDDARIKLKRLYPNIDS
mgnify:FL=1